SEYGRGRSFAKGNQLADIQGFYKAFGFELGQGENIEMADHLAVELEFYSLLLLKELTLKELNDAKGEQIVADAQGKFLKEHLGTYFESLRLRPGIQRSSFFALVVEWLAELLRSELRLKAVVVDSREYV